MNNQLWIAKWKRNDIAFHQLSINPLLQRYIANLNLSSGDQILVPLCGKSIDITWLSKSKFHVIGVELSEIAIQAYFDALKVIPEKHHQRHFTKWSYQNIEIWCGDIFDLKKMDLAKIKLLYDNASLTAFSAEDRIQYVRHFSDNLPHDCQILLITDETPDDQQFNSMKTIDSEVTALYAAHHKIELLHGENCFKKDPEYPEGPNRPMEEKVYLIKRRDFHVNG